MATFSETFNSLGNGVAISTSNSNFTTVQGTRTMVGDTSMSKSGAGSLSVSGTGTTSLFHDFTGVTTHYRRLYLYLKSAPGASTPMFAYQTAANADVLDVRITTARLLQGRNSSLVAQQTTSTAIPLNEWCRIELAAVSGTATLRLFTSTAVDAAVGSYTEQISWSYATTTIGETAIGGTVSTALSYNLDEVAASDTDWVGPLPPKVPPALTIAQRIRPLLVR